MEEAERVPIDLGHEVAASAEAGQSSAPRTTVREDGALVIDILTQRPCAPEPSTQQEIVVCVETPGGMPLQPLPPPETPSPMDILAEAFSAKIGPVEINPGLRPEGTVGMGLRSRF